MGAFWGGVFWGWLEGLHALEVLGVGYGVFREGCSVSEAGDSMMRSKTPLFCRLTLACRVGTYISSNPS